MKMHTKQIFYIYEFVYVILCTRGSWVLKEGGPDGIGQHLGRSLYPAVR